MAERNAVTKTIATRYERADKAGKARDPGRVVPDHRLASRSRAQSAAWRSATSGGSAEVSSTPDVWPESHCCADLLLGGVGHACG